MTIDALVRNSMKDAAKCDKHCDLQNSVNQKISQRIGAQRACSPGSHATASENSFLGMFLIGNYR